MSLNDKNWTDKDSKKPEYRELYEDHDFITAYGLHTDKRIEKDGPRLAIGAKADGQQDWDIHGAAQLKFLIGQGLEPHHNFLDLGCGTGRLACQMIPYLNPGKYHGLDISQGAIDEAIQMAIDNKLLKRYPYFAVGDGTLSEITGKPFEIIWAHSVFTHLPMEIIRKIFLDLHEIDFAQFCFTFKESKKPQRSGLKQFQYSVESLQMAAMDCGLRAEQLPVEWPAGQKTMRVLPG